MSHIDNGSSCDYYAGRAEQERMAAERTNNPMARRVHLELAQRYAEEIGAAPQSRSAALG